MNNPLRDMNNKTKDGFNTANFKMWAKDQNRT